MTTLFQKDDRFLVTGASSGIGLQVCRELLQAGATVIGIGRNQEALIKIISSEPFRDCLYFEYCDLAADFEKLDSYVTHLAEKYGKFSGAVLSAGIRNVSPLKTLNIRNTQKVFESNVLSNISLLKGLCRKKNNVGHGTSIVVISSIAAGLGSKGIAEYAASKAALNGAVRSIAHEVASKGVRINTISPGFVMTPMLERTPGYSEKFLKELNNSYPLGIGKPSDVAKPVIFLLSSGAGWITGSDIIVDGGGTLR